MGNQFALKEIMKNTIGDFSHELLENLNRLCAIIENADFPNVNVPCAFIESQELAINEKNLDFWISRTSSFYKISSLGKHSECLKRKQLLEWLGQLINWYELCGEK